VIIDQHHFRLAAAEERKLRDSVSGLARQVDYFPVADLHVLLEGQARGTEVSVKLTLILPGNTLVAGEHDTFVLPPFERALASLLVSLQKYKEQLGNVPKVHKTEKGTHQELHPATVLDAAAVEAAAGATDYITFRDELLPFEEGLEKRVGRWAQRYPELQAQIGSRIRIPDVVEEVFLTAFEQYAKRPVGVPLGAWLTSLIDQAVKTLLKRPDQELENINMARSARAAVKGPDAV
jgi:hypothetical protein